MFYNENSFKEAWDMPAVWQRKGTQMNDFENREDENKKEMTSGTDEGGKVQETSETDPEKEKSAEDNGKSADKDGRKTDDKESKYEDVCFICRRPESKAGKMYTFPTISASARTACTAPWIR